MNDVARKQPTKPGATSAGKPAASTIDRDKLRAAIRRPGDEYVFYMPDDSIELVPPAKLAKLVRPARRGRSIRHGQPRRHLLRELQRQVEGLHGQVHPEREPSSPTATTCSIVAWPRHQGAIRPRSAMT
jgi:hypothetical protein